MALKDDIRHDKAILRDMGNTKRKLKIDTLIEIVNRGGKVKTGVNIYSKIGVLLLEKDVLVDSPKPLEIIKQNGLTEIDIDENATGGIWDSTGKGINLGTGADKSNKGNRIVTSGHLENRIAKITELKKEATQKYQKAKQNIQKVISDIRKTGGEFDYEIVENTVTDLVGFITVNDNAFSYLTKEILSYDDYLYHHSINVCTIGTAILKKYNQQFPVETKKISRNKLFQISIGFFLHDVGKVLIPDQILNKPSRLTPEEFAIVKTHSFEKGMLILEKNTIHSAVIREIVKYHHAAIQRNEPNCYPDIESPEDLPFYVKISKFADLYDAMTSKRCYKDAFNPVGVVTEIVRKYAEKDKTLRYLLHSFIKSIGIYPAGSVVQLKNGQLGFVMDAEGPIIVPFTDPRQLPLKGDLTPLDMADRSIQKSELSIDPSKPLLSPIDTIHLLPDQLKTAISE